MVMRKFVKESAGFIQDGGKKLEYVRKTTNFAPDF